MSEKTEARFAEVTLTNGKKVRIEKVLIEGVSVGAEFVYTQMSEQLIAGVVTNEPNWQGVNFWQKLGDVFRYLGNLCLVVGAGDDVVYWHIYTLLGGSSDFRRAAIQEIGEQATFNVNTDNIDCVSISFPSVIRK